MADLTAFPNTIFEPCVLLVLAIIFHGATRIWLLCSFPALAIYANWKEISKLNKDLDFRDSVIDAEAMANYKYELEPTNMRELIMQQATTTIKNNPQVASQMKHKYPDVMSIIEELNSGKSHLADSPDSKEE